MWWWGAMTAMAWSPFPTVAPADGKAQVESYVHRRGNGACGNVMYQHIPRVPPAVVEGVLRGALTAGMYDAEFQDALALVEHYELGTLAEPLKQRYTAGAREDTAVRLLTTLSVVGPASMQPWVDAEVEVRTDAMLAALDAGTAVPAEYFALWIARRDVAAVDEVIVRARRAAGADSQEARRAADYANMYLPAIRGVAEQLAGLASLEPEARISAAVAMYASRSTDDRARPAVARVVRAAGRDPVHRGLALDAARAQLAGAAEPFERLKLLDVLETLGGPLDAASRAERTKAEAALGHGIVFELSLRAHP